MCSVTQRTAGAAGAAGCQDNHHSYHRPAGICESRQHDCGLCWGRAEHSGLCKRHFYKAGASRLSQRAVLILSKPHELQARRMPELLVPCLSQILVYVVHLGASGVPCPCVHPILGPCRMLQIYCPLKEAAVVLLHQQHATSLCLSILAPLRPDQAAVLCAKVGNPLQPGTKSKMIESMNFDESMYYQVCGTLNSPCILSLCAHPVVANSVCLPGMSADDSESKSTTL